MDVSKLQKVLIDNIGHVTFHEAYERTGRIINITVSPGNDYEKPRLLNYLTSPNVRTFVTFFAVLALLIACIHFKDVKSTLLRPYIFS
jgi:hypothetical protein